MKADRALCMPTITTQGDTKLPFQKWQGSRTTAATVKRELLIWRLRVLLPPVP
jgi:hypothetical protein